MSPRVLIPRTPRPQARLVWFLVALFFAVATSGPRAVSSGVVISQVYGAGGNMGAAYQNDFVELFNRGTSPVSLDGWSVQYASATGTGNFAANGVTSLSGTLAPGQYYLVRLAGGANGAPVPAADAFGTTNMSGTAGKVVVVNSTTGLACNGNSAPCSPAQLAEIVDLVGWGNANFSETAPAPGTSPTTAVLRIANGCTETDNNSADFAVGSPTPRTTASPLASCVSDLPPEVSTTTPSGGAANVALAADVSVTFSEPVTLTPTAFDLSCTLSGAHTVVVSGGPASFTLNPDADFAPAESCTLTVRGSEVTDQDGPPNAMSADAMVTFTTVEVCGDPATRISTIQGSGLQSLLAGSSVAIEGVVVGDFQGAGQLGGYFVQEEDEDGDGDPATSEGMFVFSTNVAVSVGDAVRVRGSVHEFSSSGTFLTELNAVAGVLACSSGNPLPAAASVTMPVAAVTDWEAYEGMRVTIPQLLTVSETFTLARFGELALSVNGRLPQPTNVLAPGAPAVAQQSLNNRSRILLDDGNGQQNIDPTLYPAGGLSAANTLRVGDSINGLSGVLDQRFGVYRVQPVGPIAIDDTNPRPAGPSAVGGTLTVASFNVLNYFNGDGLGGGFPTPRGATTLAEFNRQRAKTIAAITTLNADIAGLMELENDAAGNSAIEDLVDGLNAATAPGTYAFIDTGVVGTDEIRVGLLYKPASVTPFHAFAILDSSVDPDFIDTLNRPTLAQSFTQNSNGERVTVVVNHLKSKSSDCDHVGDPDIHDGQGNCNVTRTRAAEALVEWLAGDPTGAADPDVLIIGDLNAYAKEDPVAAIIGAGYTDLISAHIGASGYSYVFQGQSGYLDHALVSTGLAPRVTGVAEWHINADEPVALDYNVEFKTANQVNTFYASDPFRSADHDPVVVGLNLIEPYSWTGYGNLASSRTAVSAGATVPLTFSLGGDRGLNIFAAGSPASAPIACAGGTPGSYEPTLPASGSGLTYNALNGRYTYAWKTQKPWAGTCRQLTITLADGSTHSALFAFGRSASPTAP